MIRDSLMNASSERTAEASITILDRMQNFETPGIQIAAAAAVFLLLCERFRVSAQDAFTAATNLMNDADSKLKPEFQAVRLYAENEL